MYCENEVEKHIEDLQEKINKKLAEDEIKFTNEILKLSKELDGFLNIWDQICKKRMGHIRICR